MGPQVCLSLPGFHSKRSSAKLIQAVLASVAVLDTHSVAFIVGPPRINKYRVEPGPSLHRLVMSDQIDAGSPENVLANAMHVRGMDHLHLGEILATDAPNDQLDHW